jgi:hypothetical protein
MNWDQVKGNWKQLKGRGREVGGIRGRRCGRGVRGGAGTSAPRRERGLVQRVLAIRGELASGIGPD